jgi:molybdopterin-guanine dinucleotide biosynthesis protein A
VRASSQKALGSSLQICLLPGVFVSKQAVIVLGEPERGWPSRLDPQIISEGVLDVSVDDVTAIILAGGRSARFGEDKALAKVDGIPSLVRIADSLSEVASELVVASRTYSQAVLHSRVLNEARAIRGSRVNCVPDDKELRCEGPLRGMISGLRVAHGDWIVIVPCDIPFVSPTFLLTLLKRTQAVSSIVVPIWPDGRIEPQVFAFPSRVLRSTATLLSRLARSRADDIIRGAPSLSLLPLDDIEGASRALANVNRPNEFLERGDLSSGRVEQTTHERINMPWSRELEAASVQLEGLIGSLKAWKLLRNDEAWFWVGAFGEFLAGKAVGEESAGIRSESARAFDVEATMWRTNSVPFLQRHALLDAIHLLRSEESERVRRMQNTADKLSRMMSLRSDRNAKFRTIKGL